MKIIVIIVVFAFSPFLAFAQNETDSLLSGEEYEIYRAVIKDQFEAKTFSKKRFFFGWKEVKYEAILLKKTFNIGGLGPTGVFDGELTKEMIEAYWRNTGFAVKFETEKLSTENIKVKLKNDKDWARINFTQKNAWKKFHRKYPTSGGLTELSAIGFNQEKTKALLCIGIQADYSLGGGYFYLLEKIKGKWTVKKVAPAWQS